MSLLFSIISHSRSVCLGCMSTRLKFLEAFNFFWPVIYKDLTGSFARFLPTSPDQAEKLAPLGRETKRQRPKKKSFRKDVVPAIPPLAPHINF